MPEQRRAVTVLVAEDDPDDRLMMREAWVEAGLGNDLRFVKDGGELLDYLFRRGAFSDPATSPRPGLILLDLNMPGLDGRGALREIRANEKLRSIPVVVLTTSDASEDVTLAYERGANSYLRKPTTFSGLSDAVKTIGRYWLEVAVLPIEPGDDQSG